MMNKVEGKPAMIPSDVSGQGEKRVKLPDPVTVEQAREILKKVREAKRPVINAGNGIRIGKAFDVFARVVKKLGIPVVTGWNSIDCMYDRSMWDVPDIWVTVPETLRYRTAISYCHWEAVSRSVRWAITTRPGRERPM